MPDSDLQVALTASFSNLQAGMEQASRSVEESSGRISTSLNSMSARSREAFNAVKEGAISLPAPIERVNEAVHSLELTFKEFGKLAIVGLILEVVNKFRELASESIESGVALEHMAQRTGISVDSLASLQKVAGLAGVGMEGFERSMRQLSVKLVQAREGSSSAQQAFARLHLTVGELSGLSADQVFLRVADATAKMKDGMDKAGAVAGLLGARMGTQLIPLFNEGSAGIKRLQSDFELLGTTNKEQAESMEKAHIALSTMATAVESAGRALVVALVPAIQAVAKYVEFAVFGWEFLIEVISDAVKWLEGKLAPAIQFVEKVLHPFTAAVSEAAGAVENWAGSAARAAGAGGIIDDIANRYEEAKKKIQAANDIGAASSIFGGGGQGDEGIGGAGGKGGKVKQILENFIAEKRLEEAEHEKDVAFKIAAETQIYNESVKLFGATSTEARKALLDVQKAKNEQVAENQRLALEDLTNEQKIADAKVSAVIDAIKRQAKAKEDALKGVRGTTPGDQRASLIAAQNIETDALVAAENQRYAEKEKSLNAQLQLLNEHAELNKAAIAKLNTDLEVAEIEHQKNLTDIRQEAADKEVQINKDANNKILQDQQRMTVKIEDTFESLFDKMLTATGKGTDSIKAIWIKFTQQLSRDTIESAIFGGNEGTLGAKIFGQKGQGGGLIGGLLGLAGLGGGGGQAALTAALTANTAAITANTASAATKSAVGAAGGLAGAAQGQGGVISAIKAFQASSLAQGAAHLAVSIGHYAAFVAHAAFTAVHLAITSAQSLIHTVYLALIAALQAVKSVPVIGGFLEGGGVIPSAAGGMVVGGSADGGTLAVLHPREMVLPRALSEGVQRMIGKDGNESGNAGRAGDTHVHIHAIDTQDFADHLSEHAETIAGILNNHARRGGYLGRP